MMLASRVKEASYRTRLGVAYVDRRLLLVLSAATLAVFAGAFEIGRATGSGSSSPQSEAFSDLSLASAGGVPEALSTVPDLPAFPAPPVRAHARRPAPIVAPAHAPSAVVASASLPRVPISSAPRHPVAPVRSVVRAPAGGGSSGGGSPPAPRSSSGSGGGGGEGVSPQSSAGSGSGNGGGSGNGNGGASSGTGNGNGNSNGNSGSFDSSG